MIFVITHKVFEDLFIDREHYSILHVGNNKNCKTYYLRDDVGDNISNKNSSFCELTGLYWIWKNDKDIPDSISGLVHYRRFFTTKIQDILYTYFNIRPKVLNYRIIEKALKRADVIVPSRIRIFRTVRQFYSDIHESEDLELTREAIKRAHPESLESYEAVMDSHYFYYANMMICKRRLLDDYCRWLFEIMDELEPMIHLDKYDDAYQKRVFGFIAERLLQVWIVDNKLKVKEFPVFNTECKRITIFRKNRNRIMHFMNKKGFL